MPPLGIICSKNENAIDEMIAIMEEPTQTKEFCDDGGGDSVLVDDYNFHKILISRTAARCQGSTATCGDHGTSLQRLEGLVTVSEDWHSK